MLRTLLLSIMATKDRTGLSSEELTTLIYQLKDECYHVACEERMAMKCMGLTSCPKCSGKIERRNHIGMVSVKCLDKACDNYWEEAGKHDAPKLGW